MRHARFGYGYDDSTVVCWDDPPVVRCVDGCVMTAPDMRVDHVIACPRNPLYTPRHVSLMALHMLRQGIEPAKTDTPPLTVEEWAARKREAFQNGY